MELSEIFPLKNLERLNLKAMFRTLMTAKMFILLFSILPLAVPGHCQGAETGSKAASPYTNCGCQCSSITFRDTQGVVQGNCNREGDSL